jgi:hypothetical protein
MGLFGSLTLDEADALQDRLLSGAGRLAANRDFRTSLEVLDVQRDVSDTRRERWNRENPDFKY